MNLTIKLCGAVLSAAVVLTGCKTTDANGTVKSAFFSEPIKSTNALEVVKVSNKKRAAKSKDKRPYSSIIARHAAANNVPIDLAHAVVFSESTYRANARGAAGEIGLMQLRPATARLVGYKGSSKGLYDPETNIKYGMRYLGKARQLAGGSTCGTILRYNAGHGAKRMNPISQRYCTKVKRLLSK